MCAGTGFMTPIGEITGINISVNAAKVTVYESGNYKYTLNDDGTVTIVGYNKDLKEEYVKIPDKLDGKTVTAIGENAFGECTSLLSVEIPSSVSAIEDNAFVGCEYLSYVNIFGEDSKKSKLQSIGKGAFKGCVELSSLIIPDSVEKIGEKLSNTEINF